MPRTPDPPRTPEGTVWFGGDVQQVRVCLRLLGDQLEPAEITCLLDNEPTQSGRKGEPILRPSGEVLRHRRVGAWLLELPPDSDATVEEAIGALLSTLPEGAALWQSLTQRFQVDLLCDVTVRGLNQGFILCPDVLKRVARLGVSLGVDVFTEADDNQAAALSRRLDGSA